MQEYKYILEPYKGRKTRHTCPGCGKPQCFSMYVATETGEYLNDNVGRCNRETSCNYHYSPREFFQDNPDYHTEGKVNPVRLAQVRKAVERTTEPPSYFDRGLFEKSRTKFDENNLVSYFLKKFGRTNTTKILNQYLIGTSKHFGGGAAVLWQIDTRGNIRAGKVMQFNPETGKRIKQPYSMVSWIQSILKMEDFNSSVTFFGCHLLRLHPTKPVCIVESERAACVMSLYIPECLWLAVGSLSYLTVERCEILAGRVVCLFPDLSGKARAEEKWIKRAQELNDTIPSALFEVLTIDEIFSGVMPITDEDRAAGLDIEDMIYRIDCTPEQWQNIVGQGGNTFKQGLQRANVEGWVTEDGKRVTTKLIA